MKFKLDENLSPAVAALLGAAGHDVDTVVGERLSGADDERVFQAARTEGRTLMTLDLDFSNPLRFDVQGTAGIIVIRPARPLEALIQATVQAALPQFTDAVNGRLWIVEPGRIREHTPSEE